MLTKKALVIHSGGMDSSICLRLAAEAFGREKVLSLSFDYGQRHGASELVQARELCSSWDIDHERIEITFLSKLTKSSLTDPSIPIEQSKGSPPNSLVAGRNGLMARLGALYAHTLGARCLYMGVLELEEANSGYRDCSRSYMDLMEKILRIDLGEPLFEIRTPLIRMTKKETLELAYELGVLDELLEKTVSCYLGLRGAGCTKCPACLLKKEGLDAFAAAHPEAGLN